jgi:hypothetical protein
LFSRAAKNFGIGEQRQLKLAVSVQRSEKCWNWRTNAGQVDCNLFSHVAKFFGIGVKATQIDCICSAAHRKIFKINPENKTLQKRTYVVGEGMGKVKCNN